MNKQQRIDEQIEALRADLERHRARAAVIRSNYELVRDKINLLTEQIERNRRNYNKLIEKL